MMRLVSSHGHQWAVYDDEHEFRRSGLVDVPLIRAKEGDYVRDTYGIYVPVIRRVEGVNHKGSKYIRWLFPPNYSVLRYIAVGKDYNFSFRYNPEREIVRKVSLVKLNVMANLIEGGYDVWDAARIAYGKGFSTRTVLGLLDKSFVERLRRSKLLMGIGEKLRKAGITEERIAEIIRGSIESKDFAERRWAIELALKYIDKGDSGSKGILLRSIEVERVEKLLSDKVPGILTEGSDE